QFGEVLGVAVVVQPLGGASVAADLAHALDAVGPVLIDQVGELLTWCLIRHLEVTPHPWWCCPHRWPYPPERESSPAPGDHASTAPRSPPTRPAPRSRHGTRHARTGHRSTRRSGGTAPHWVAPCGVLTASWTDRRGRVGVSG